MGWRDVFGERSSGAELELLLDDGLELLPASKGGQSGLLLIVVHSVF